MTLLLLYNHNEKEVQRYFASYQRQGNDKNGNTLYIVNIWDGDLINVNYRTGRRLDKYGNIKIHLHNPKADIQQIIKLL